MLFFVLNVIEVASIFYGIVRLSKLKFSEYGVLLMLGGSMMLTPLLFGLLGQPAMFVFLLLWSFFFFFQTEKKSKGILYVFGVAIVGAISDFSIDGLLLLLTTSGFEFSNLVQYDIIDAVGTSILIVVLSLTLKYLLDQFNVNQLVDQHYLPILALCLIVIAAALFLDVFVIQAIKSSFIQVFCLFLAFALHALILVVILTLMVRITKDIAKTENKRVEFEQQFEYVVELEKQYASISNFQHDYGNILLSLSHYIINKDLDGLKKYFEEKIAPTEGVLSNSRRYVGRLVNLKIQSLKGLVLVKLSSAQLFNIKVIMDIPLVVADINVDEITLSRIMGIIIDNAIEESVECEEAFIEIGIVRKADRCLIAVVNGCRPDLVSAYQMAKRGYTTKSGENRGLGLSNLHQLISRTKGASLNTEITAGKFAQVITIMDNEKGSDES